MITKLLNK